MIVKRKTKSKKVISTFILAFFVVVFLFVSLDIDESAPHTNPIDTKISQHSNRNITPNAIITNQKFKDLAFESVSPKNYLLKNQIATAIRSLKYLTLIFSDKEDATPEHGTWIWTPTLQMSEDYIDSIIIGAKENNINAIYLSIDSYLDIFALPKGIEKDRQKELFSEKISYFIKEANKMGIEVDAEAGWKNWAEEDNAYKPIAILEFVKEFNSINTYKFRGFQYDVEPYLLENYEAEKESVLKNFVSLIDQTEHFLEDSGLRFSVVVPSFYDKKDGMTPRFSYNGSLDYIFGHLMSILERREGNSIIIMSYRNFAEGEDGAIAISKNEMRTARNRVYNSRVIIAQETSDVPPPYITFHKKTKAHLLEQLNKIDNAFNSYESFGGTAIHYINSYLDLE